jgi:hypothetical protein
MARLNADKELSEKDELVLRDLIRFGELTFEQIARRYCEPTYKRLLQLARLREERYVVVKPDFPTTVSFYMATHRAVRAVQSGMPELKKPPIHPEHDLSVVNLADWLVDENPGSTWFTERELHRMLPKRESWGRRSRGGHPPDGALALDGRLIGVELERQFVTHAKYVEACRWYAEHIEFDEVRWYVLSDRLEREIPRIVRFHGLDSDIQIVTLPIPPEVELVGWQRR